MRSIFTLFLSLAGCIAYGQHVIKGRIRSSSDTTALAGATVQLINSTTSTKSDQNGSFTLSSDRSQGRLRVSYLGYQPKEVAFDVQGNQTYDVVLQVNDNSLDEVQIIGYGETTKRLNTGSVVSISAKEIEQQPVTNVLSALSGRMAGVFVQTTNGLPGGNINIQIRGTGSIAAGTNPLYIIDGVPFDGGVVNQGSRLATENIAGTISPLNNLNPNDIESISVLKDADATAIYGSRGSNGVVLITTKKGESGKTRFQTNITQGFDQVANQPRLLNISEYLAIRREAFANDGKTPSSNPTSPDYAPDLTVWDTTQNTDWFDYLLGNTAHSTNAQASISGGNENINFLISGNYRNENTVMIGDSKFQRGGINSQMQYKSSNQRFVLTLSNNMTKGSTKLPNPVGNLANTIFLPPHYPIYDEDGNYNKYLSNISAELHSQSNTETNNTITNITMNYNIIQNLGLKISGGYNSTSYGQVIKFPAVSLRPNSINYTTFGENASQSFVVEPQANFNLNKDTFSLSILAGGTYQSRSTDGQALVANNFTVESLMENLASAGDISTRTNNNTEYRYASIFGRLTFNLANRYIINGTMRRDGSSRFGQGNRFGNFGSIGGVWIFTEEDFMKNVIPFLSFGKLRASYGTVGNDQIADYQYLSTYVSSGATLYQGIPRLVPSRIANANFRWETTKKIEAAIELGLIKDRVLFTANYYLNRSDDQLVLYNIPQITGFANYQANIPAVIENKGLEMDINARIVQTKNFLWTSTFNITFPKNQLKSFENFEASSYAQQYELGYDLNRIFGYNLLSVDPDTGSPMYADRDGQPSTSPYYYHTLGKFTPSHYGGLGNTVSYKSFQLDIFFQFVKQLDRSGIQFNQGLLINNYSYVLNRWTSAGQITDVPKSSTNQDFYFRNSSANVFDTSFLRLKNISLSYDVDKNFLKSYGVNGLRLFLQGQNLLTFWDDNVPVIDPESGSITSTSKNIPPLKSLAFGAQLNF